MNCMNALLCVSSPAGLAGGGLGCRICPPSCGFHPPHRAAWRRVLPSCRADLLRVRVELVGSLPVGLSRRRAAVLRSSVRVVRAIDEVLWAAGGLRCRPDPGRYHPEHPSVRKMRPTVLCGSALARVRLAPQRVGRARQRAGSDGHRDGRDPQRARRAPGRAGLCS
jgi:hypothetical protein